jgi:hypothetical protein
MNSSSAEKILINYVQNEINSGKKKIIIPADLIRDVKKGTFDEIKNLCKLNGVELEVQIKR